MVYTPKDWQDSPSTATPITAAELERMEDGIQEGLRAASEVQTGNVELASSGEMTTGTDTTRVPSVKRVADYVATQIAAGLASLPSASQASESASGVVELASAAEVTAGTDLARVPSVKRIVDYITSAINTSASAINATITSGLAGKADVSGSIRQFSDVDDNAPSQSDYMRYDTGSQLWRPHDMSAEYAEIGVDGRIISQAQPQYYVPLLVINEGDSVPSSYPTNGIVLSRPLTASIVPNLIGQNKSTSGTVCTVTTTDVVNVGDYIIFGVGTDGSTTTGTLPTTHTFAYSSGAAAVSAGPVDYRSGTIQSNIYYARCTTQIPAGATITMTANQTRGHLQLTVAKVTNLFATIGSVVDKTSSTNANNTSLNMSIPTTTATGQPSELAISVWGYAPGAAYPTPTRTFTPGSGWTQIGSVNYSETTTYRASIMTYKVLTSIETISSTAVCTSSDGTTGPWAAVLASFKAA